LRNPDAAIAFAHPMTSLQRLLTAALAVALLLPAAAQASSSMETGIADDAALLNEPSDAKAASAVAAWAALGIDDVRIFVQWQAIAPANSEVKAPDGFDSADPNSPGYDWSKVDRAVNLVSAAGMRPLLVVTGPGPLWASQVPARHSVRYKPRPDLFAQFARAAALRYAQAVDRWVIWNEPNLPLWLQPQNTCKGRRCTPYAPHLYRRLVRAAYPAIKTVDPTSTVLFGALAPNGENATKQNARTRPLAFIRSMGCVKATLQRDRSGPCSGFKPLTGDGLAYHPHATKLAPNEQQAILDNASIGDLGRLERTLDGTQRAGGLKKPGGGKFSLYFTEWGYQTRPPDRTRGVSLAKQSRYLQQGTYIGYKDPRVKLLTQYEWRDERVRRSASDAYSGWQSGLRTFADNAKPSLKSFANPFVVDQKPGSRSARLWGQVRPGVTHRITVQRRKPGAKRWTTVRTLTTNGLGYWKLTQTVRTTTDYRFTWQPTDEYDAPVGPIKASDVQRAKGVA
jgi:hypothetical protein